MAVITTEKPYDCNIKIWHGEDWYDPLPQLVDPVTGNPINLDPYLFELFIRPSFDYITKFVRLTTEGSAGLVKEDNENGLLAIHYPRDSVEDNIPISNSEGWRQFLRMTWTDDVYGEVSKHLWVGPILVFPAKDT